MISDVSYAILHNGEEYAVDRVVMHSGWLWSEFSRLDPSVDMFCELYGDDIALMKLSKPINHFNNRPCLPEPFVNTLEQAQYKECKVAGNGMTSVSDQNSNDFFKKIHQVSLNILPFEKCISSYNEGQQLLQGKIYEKTFCMKNSEYGKAPCSVFSKAKFRIRKKS